MYKPGNNVGDLHYIWHGDPSEKDTTVLEQSLHVVEKLHPTFPKFSTQAMRKSSTNILITWLAYPLGLNCDQDICMFAICYMLAIRKEI